jgi:5-methylcytosine-specific restriction endonuclease McrA
MLVTNVTKTYHAYMRSQEWAAKRLERLILDQYQCQGYLSHRATQVHHKSYEHFGHEPMSDLMSLCDTCHTALTTSIRAQRYRARKLRVQAIQRVTPTILRDVRVQVLTIVPTGRIRPTTERIDRGLQNLIVSPQKRITPADAPRRIG